MADLVGRQRKPTAFQQQVWARRRAKLNAALITPDCGTCGAVPGESCTVLPGTEVIRLDRHQELYAHPDRIQAAITAGLVRRDLVAAQFQGGLPASLQTAGAS